MLPGIEWKILEGYSGWVRCLTVFDKDSKAISGGADETLKVWDLRTGSCVHTLQGHSGRVLCSTVFDGDSKAISGSADETLKVWNLPLESDQKQGMICSYDQSIAESIDEKVQIESTSAIEPVFEIESSIKCSFWYLLCFPW